jgi:hypothetical protein
MTGPDEPHVFPTLSRAKHSHLVSYPIGAEALSRALDGVPQHRMLACDFYAGSAHQHLDMTLQLVLSVVYRRHPGAFHFGRDAASRGVFDPRWTIGVFAIGRVIRHAVKTRLLVEGLPDLVRPWLLDAASVTGKSGECGLTLHYDSVEHIFVPRISNALLPDRS